MHQEHWREEWFNEDYLKLYKNHHEQEAKRDRDFIIQNLQLKGGEKILDVGCGFGRHVILFALKGYSIIGIDASKTLIEKAQSLAEEQNLPSSLFYLGDIRDASFLGQFDVALSLFTSIGYSDDAGNKQVLSSIRSHLPKGKFFFLDYLNPEYVLQHLIPHEEKMIEGENIVIERAIVNDTIHKKIHFPKKIYEEKVKLYDYPTLTHLLKDSQLEIIKTFGDFSGNTLSHESPRQILIAQAI